MWSGSIVRLTTQVGFYCLALLIYRFSSSPNKSSHDKSIHGMEHNTESGTCKIGFLKTILPTILEKWQEKEHRTMNLILDVVMVWGSRLRNVWCVAAAAASDEDFRVVGSIDCEKNLGHFAAAGIDGSHAIREISARCSELQEVKTLCISSNTVQEFTRLFARQLTRSPTNIPAYNNPLFWVISGINTWKVTTNMDHI